MNDTKYQMMPFNPVLQQTLDILLVNLRNTI